MFGKLTTLCLSAVLAVSLTGCKQEDKKETKAPANMPQEHGLNMPKSETTVVVPDSVKGKWKGVIIKLENKSAKKNMELKIDLNTELSVPDSALKISVGEFLPDFTMDGKSITSSTNDLKNPAVGIKVHEGGVQLFPQPGKQWGWLFSNFPDIHNFDHKDYKLTLKEGLKK